MLRDCIYLLEVKDKNMGYCLKYRGWRGYCPIKCGECVSGEMGAIKPRKRKSTKYDK